MPHAIQPLRTADATIANAGANGMNLSLGGSHP